jgi:CHAT domain-containing protein
LVAYSLLKLADLEQELGNHEESARLYDQSYQVNDSPYFEFEIQKGRLRSFLAVGNDSELERQIPKTIQIAEENRLKILEEEQSNSFFHNESSVFDTAIEWEFGRGNFQKAYDYAEGASARSLLDLLERNKSSKHTSPNETAYSLVKATPLKLNEIQAQIPEETQLLQYTVLDKKVLIWLVTKDKLIVKQLPVSLEDLQNKVERFINLILEDKKEVSQETIQLSKELFSLLVQPIYEELDKKKQICLIPNKVLFFLPFSALLSSEEKFFLEEFVIFYAPSANIFIHCTKNAEKKADQTSESILSIGNPSFDTVVFSDLSSLEFAEIEAKNIAKLYDKSTVLLNKAATKRAFHQNISNADVLHFAGHYIVKPDMPLLSSLLFAKEGEEPEQSSLTNGELYSENLNHLKLVILSSCETGVESYLNGEGMIGLSRTFLAMNTPIVVASQWKVDSEATAILMNKFHHFRRQQKLPTAVALRKAQLEMLNDNKFKTPYYWSAFASFGGYSKF